MKIMSPILCLFANRVKVNTQRAAHLLFCFISIVGANSTLLSQKIIREYTIKRKGDVVGHLVFTHTSYANTTTLRLASSVKTKLMVASQGTAKEESVFQNDVLTMSSIYREMNGNEKVNKTTSLKGSHYLIQKGSTQEILDYYPIRFNMLSMYAFEPKSISKVYSDNYQKFFDVHKTGDQRYKVNFPGGNSTEYFYQNGVCVKAKVSHAFYDVTIELSE